MHEKDHGLDALLDLDGFIAEVGNGYWVKIEAKLLMATTAKPHGVDYSLTLHAPNGDRILGYDNAHPIKVRSGPTRKEAKANDHKHRKSAVRRYEYKSAGELLEDFWKDVDVALKDEGVLT